MGGDHGAGRQGHAGGHGVPTAPSRDRARLSQCPGRRGAGGYLRPVRGPDPPTTRIGALPIRTAVSSGPLTAAWHARPLAAPADLSNKSGIDALLQGTRSDYGDGVTGVASTSRPRPLSISDATGGFERLMRRPMVHSARPSSRRPPLRRPPETAAHTVSTDPAPGSSTQSRQRGGAALDLDPPGDRALRNPAYA